MKKIFYGMILSIVLLTACSTRASNKSTLGNIVSVDGGEYLNINAVELNNMMSKKDFVLVNVHVPFSGDIPSTDYSIPFDKIEENMSILPEDKNAKIVIYCRSGSMSGVSAKTLIQLGYTNIWNLEQGFNSWEREGFELAGK